MEDRGRVADETELRKVYPPVVERARLKTQVKLDNHCRNFIARAPFVCLGSSSEKGADVTPRGDQPGFVLVLDDTTLAIPDWPGNNRLDSLSNILLNPRVALLFLIPGVDETLRVSGTAEISTSSELLERWQRNGKMPRTALVVTVGEAFFHCGKALIRSRLWRDDYKIQRSELPAYGEILKDQIVTSETAEEIEVSIQSGYRNKLY